MCGPSVSKPLNENGTLPSEWKTTNVTGHKKNYKQLLKTIAKSLYFLSFEYIL